MPSFLSEHYVLEVKLRRDKVPSFGQFPFSLPAIAHLDALKLHPKVTFIIGENGSGKSTLLEGIAVAFGLNPEGGTRNFRFATRASHSPLFGCLRLIKSAKRARLILPARRKFLQCRDRDRKPGCGVFVRPAHH